MPFKASQMEKEGWWQNLFEMRQKTTQEGTPMTLPTMKKRPKAVTIEVSTAIHEKLRGTKRELELLLRKPVSLKHYFSENRFHVSLLVFPFIAFVCVLYFFLLPFGRRTPIKLKLGYCKLTFRHLLLSLLKFSLASTFLRKTDSNHSPD